MHVSLQFHVISQVGIYMAMWLSKHLVLIVNSIQLLQAMLDVSLIK